MVPHRGRHGRLDGVLDHCAHPDHRWGGRCVDIQQPGPLQDEQGVAGRVPVSRATRAAGGQVVSGRPGAEHCAGRAMPVQQAGQRQQRLHRAAGGQPVGLLDREPPGDRGGGGLGPGYLGELGPPVHEIAAVIPAGQRRAGDHPAGLSQGQRLVAQVGDQVDGAQPLVGVRGEPAYQVAQRLPGAERADREDPGLGLGGQHPRAGRGDQHAARRAAWPQPGQIGCGGQVIEHHQPGLAGLGQPADERSREGVGVPCRVAAQHVQRRLRITGQH